MATLEKIRSKSVLLIVVIGVALFAFIVGDALTNGQNLFGDPTTVAKVDGHKIDITEFQRKLEERSQQNQNSQRPADEQMLTKQVLDEMVMETLIESSIEKLGIEVSSEQLRKHMFENYGNQDVAMLVQQMNAAGMPAKTPEEAHDMIFNPKKYGLPESQVEGLQLAWIGMENDAKKQIKIRTYANLLQNTFKANDLDKKALYDDMNVSYNVKLAFKSYGALDAEKYPVTDAELKEEYAKVMNEYKLDEPTKAIQFISMTINPSQKDVEAAKELARGVVASLKESNDVTKDQKGMGVVANHKVLRAKDITGPTKSFVTSAPQDSVSIIREDINGFTIVKMGKTSQEVDSIQLNIVNVVGDKLPAKVLASLNSGASIDSIQNMYKDSVMVQKEMWQQLVTAQGRTMIEKSKLDTLLAAGPEYFEFMKQPESAMLVKVVKKNAPVTVYEYEEATYTLAPSNETIAAERERLEKFIAENNTTAKLVANAAQAGFAPMSYLITASTPAIGNQPMYQPNSRQVVKWAMLDASNGEVSEIFESLEGSRPQLYVAAVEADYDQYLPFNYHTVKATLERNIRSAKAGDEMLKQFEGKKTIDEVAQAMGVTVSERVVEFGNPNKLGDAATLGRIVNTAAGKPVVVVKGKNGVYAFEVVSVDNNKLEYEASKYADQFNAKHRPDFEKIFRGNKEIENMILKFYGGR